MLPDVFKWVAVGGVCLAGYYAPYVIAKYFGTPSSVWYYAMSLAITACIASGVALVNYGWVSEVIVGFEIIAAIFIVLIGVDYAYTSEYTKWVDSIYDGALYSIALAEFAVWAIGAPWFGHFYAVSG